MELRARPANEATGSLLATLHKKSGISLGGGPLSPLLILAPFLVLLLPRPCWGSSLSQDFSWKLLEGIDGLPEGGDPAGYSGGQQQSFKPNRCRFPGCGKSASYGLLGQTVRIACSIHRSPQHVAMNQRGCHVCGRRAYWGMPGGGVERYCTMHRQDGHVDVVSRRCEEKGCAKRPVFGNAVDKKAKARFCKLHAPQGHTNVNTHQGRGVKSKEREGQSRRRAEDRGGEESSRGGAGVKEEGCSSRGQWVGGGREGEDMDECRDREQGGEEDGENKWGFPATWLDNMPLHMWELPACAGCGANIGDSSSFMVYPCKHTFHDECAKMPECPACLPPQWMFTEQKTA